MQYNTKDTKSSPLVKMADLYHVSSPFMIFLLPPQGEILETDVLRYVNKMYYSGKVSCDFCGMH